MKKLIGTTAFLAVIAMATTSCQKEDNDPFDSNGVIARKDNENINK